MDRASSAEVEALLDYVRNRQRLVQWKGRHLVPAGVAGWLEVADGGPTDRDGQRPFPAIRAELLELIRRADLPAVDRSIVESWFGLHRYPTDLSGSSTALDARFAAKSGRIDHPLSARSVQARRAEAILHLAEFVERRPRDADVPYAALPPVWLEAWCRPLSTHDLEAAQRIARDRLRVDDSEVGSESNSLHAQLDELVARAKRTREDVPQRLARANAALTIALWDQLRPDLMRRQLADAVPLRTAVPLAVLQTAPAGAAALLRGNHDDGSLLDAVDSVVDGSVPPDVAWPILEVCLSALRYPMKRSPAVHVHVLFRAGRYARASEDWRTVTLATWLVTDFPTSTYALHADVDASVVAGAHRQFDLALSRLDHAESLLPGVRWPRGRDPLVEQAEWAYQLRLAKTAVIRRAAEDAVAHRRRDRWTPLGAALVEECLSEVLKIPGFDGQASSSGDADAGYVALARLRRAEFALVKAHELTLEAKPRSTIRALLAQVQADVQESGQWTSISRSADVATLSAKLELGVAVVRGAPEVAEKASVRLLRLGWPLERSTMSVLLAMHEQIAGHQHRSLTPAMRTAAAAALTARTNDQLPAQRVSGARRRTQYLD